MYLQFSITVGTIKTVLLCLAVFGSDRFLVPAMLLIALALGLKKEEQE